VEELPGSEAQDAIVPEAPNAKAVEGKVLQLLKNAAKKMESAEAAPPEAETPQRIKDTRVTPILTAAYKVRKTRKLVLPNGLKVLIISDPKISQSAAGLANMDGDWNNPRDALGLAHFTEHMVFMGTKADPKANSLDTFLGSHGGQMSNAATSSQTTQFAFAVPHDGFAEGLKKFTAMFTEPLFTAEALKKEIHAVNQEYEMHKDDDGWRQLFVMKNTANQKHPYHYFAIGTLKTLGKVNHDKIKKFYDKHYSANLMSACVYTVLPMDQAEALVQKQFGTIPNRKLTRKNINVPLLDPALKGTAVWQKSLQTTHSITMKWELPKKLGQTNHKVGLARPDQLLDSVLNYGGKHSIYSQLRKAKLAHSISSGRENVGYHDSMYLVTVSLTPEGNKQWQKVVGMVFAALNKIKKIGIPKHIFDTKHTMDLNSWQWQWRTTDVFSSAQSTASSIAHSKDFSAYPWVENIIQEYDPALVQELLTVLTPADVHIYAMSPNWPAKTGKIKVQTEPHYHVEWKVLPIEKSTLSEWAANTDADYLQMPGPNPYLPKHLHITKQLDAHPPVYPNIPEPVKLLDTPEGRLHLWHDKVFGDPYVQGQIVIKTDRDLVHQQGAAALVQTSLLTSCFTHALIEELTPFNEAGYQWSLGAGLGTDMVVSFSGMNPDPQHYNALISKLASHLQKVADGKLSELVDAPTFRMLQVSTLHGLQNSLKQSPVSASLQAMHEAMQNMQFSVKDKIAATKKATLKSVQDFGAQQLSNIYLDGLFSGQMEPHHAKKAWSSFVDAISQGSKALPKKKWPEGTMRLLPQQPLYLHKQGDSKAGNSAVLVVDAGDLDCKERMAFNMLYKVLPDAFYDDLRSKQQTGYLVQSSATSMIPHHQLAIFLVQSTLYLPGDLTKRYLKFISNMLVDLKSKKGKILPAARFESIKESSLAAYKTPNENIKTVSSLMSSLLQDYNGVWSTMAKKKELATQMEYSDVLAVAEKIFGQHNQRQLTIAYTPKSTKLDTMPSQFVAFKTSMGKFIKKPKFSCPAGIANAASVQSLAVPVKSADKAKLKEITEILDDNDKDLADLKAMASNMN
jgi:insulysin